MPRESARQDRKFLMYDVKRYIDDIPVTLTEYSHTKTKDSHYTSLRLIIPKKMQEILGIKKGSEIKFEKLQDSITAKIIH